VRAFSPPTGATQYNIIVVLYCRWACTDYTELLRPFCVPPTGGQITNTRIQSGVTESTGMSQR